MLIAMGVPVIASVQESFTFLEEYGQITVPVWGSQVKTLSYEPEGGKFSGYNIPHAESYSLVDFLKTPAYRPSVYYSYLMPDDAKLMMNYGEYSLDKDSLPIDGYHVLRSDEIVQSGYDSVGCLMYFRRPSSGGLEVFWTGTVVDNVFAKKVSPEVNATGIQVAISVLAAVKWMLKNKTEGIIEPEHLDTDFILEYCKPYLGKFFDKRVSPEDYTPPGDRFVDLAMMSSIFFKT
jgi:homospermidine synthase